MQNVVCPIAIVQNPGAMSARWNAELSAMPVTMPGRAIGRMKPIAIRSLPRNVLRASASAASVPSTTAARVAPSATSADNISASSTSGRVNACENQRAVTPFGGNVKALSSVLKAYTATSRMGTYRNASPR
jgi:hypothetical protein